MLIRIRSRKPGGRRRPVARGLNVEPVRLHSDARPTEPGGRGRGERDAEALRRRKLHRKIAVLALCGVFAAGAATALFGKGGYLELQRLRHERETVRLELEQQQAAVIDLQDEIHRLEHDPMARERIAREQLGFSRPGEITFLLPSDGTGEGLIPQPEEGKQAEPIR